MQDKKKSHLPRYFLHSSESVNCGLHAGIYDNVFLKLSSQHFFELVDTKMVCYTSIFLATGNAAFAALHFARLTFTRLVCKANLTDLRDNTNMYSHMHM